jgi:hypothetical protein
MPMKINLVINRGQYNKAVQQPVIRSSNPSVSNPAQPPVAASSLPRMSLKHGMGPNTGCKSCGS